MLASTLRSAGLQGSALQHSSRRSQAPLITAAGPRLAAWQGGALPRPSAARPLAARQQLAARQPARSRRGQLAVVAARGGGDNVDIADRVVSSLVYFMPLADGLRYGKFFFLQFPAFQTILIPLEPLIRLYYSVPFAGLVVFFGVYLGIINNPRFSRYVRYNAMQAVLLDIILIVPGLLESVFRPPMGGPGLQVYITLYNTIWLFVFACVAYGVGSCLSGTTARLPIVADAADAQVR